MEQKFYPWNRLPTDLLYKALLQGYLIANSVKLHTMHRIKRPDSVRTWLRTFTYRTVKRSSNFEVGFNAGHKKPVVMKPNMLKIKCLWIIQSQSYWTSSLISCTKYHIMILGKFALRHGMVKRCNQDVYNLRSIHK